jgi:flavin-dependent dehydrogenase
MEGTVSILIAGGSLAGIACALRLQQLGHQPLVLEKSRFPRPKLCGEFLGPDAFPVLRQLDVWPLVEAQAWGPVEKVYFHNMQGKSLKIRLTWMDSRHPYALALPREQLDQLLMLEARKRDIQVLEERRILSPVQTQNGQFRVSAEARGEGNRPRIETCSASFLIDATGRNGRLHLESSATDVAEANRNRERIGIQCHVWLPEPSPHKDLHMFFFPGGYGGIQPIGENMINLCMLVDASMGKLLHLGFPELIAGTIGQNPVAARMLQHGERVSPFHTTADLNLNGQRRHAHRDLIRIGDALITVDPFTGSGMAHALQTGVLAADCLHQGIQAGWNYAVIRQHYHRQYARIFKTRLRLLRIFRPVLDSPGVQQMLWPLLPSALPALTRLFR